MLGRNFDPFNQQPQNLHRPLAGTRIPSPGDDKREQRKQVMRFLFHPELGQGFQSLTGTHKMFVKLVANLFLQTGLVDATYPGFRDPQQLGIISLIITAYRGLEFNEAGMPRVLLFVAFVGSLFTVVFSLAIFLFSFASHSAGSGGPPPAATPPAVPR